MGHTQYPCPQSLGPRGHPHVPVEPHAAHGWPHGSLAQMSSPATPNCIFRLLQLLLIQPRVTRIAVRRRGNRRVRAHPIARSYPHGRKL